MLGNYQSVQSFGLILMTKDTLNDPPCLKKRQFQFFLSSADRHSRGVTIA